jgi:regulator of protease activity HflC (stomatin/prohibitin superfamily)
MENLIEGGKLLLPLGRKGLEAAKGAARRLQRVVFHPLTIVAAVLVGLGYGTFRTFVEVEPAQGAVRLNRLTGRVSLLSEGWWFAPPGVTRLVRFPLREQMFHSDRGTRTGAAGAFQSMEGLSVGADVTVRYAFDVKRVVEIADHLPANAARELIEPVMDAAVHRALAQHTVKEIFSTGRHEIEEQIQKEVTDRLTPDGILVHAVFLGNVDLPREYMNGMEQLLAEELAAEKMRFTLDLKEKQVKESELMAEADKVKREKEAEALGNQEIIAAKAKGEAMKHILPYKEREIEQRRLEAEAASVTRLKAAEAEAEAHRIEAAGEADSRRKLADAEAYRVEVTGKATSEQLAREGAVVSQNPLLIQKTLADKLSDKIQVIITPPHTGFVAGGLLGMKDGDTTVAAAAPPRSDARASATSAPSYDQTADNQETR